jgi:peptidoglycan/LPS O-acetylase OafA/YrhL
MVSLTLGLPFVDVLALGLVFEALRVKHGLYSDMLNWYPLQWLGRYGYSIYLLHYPCSIIANRLIADGTTLSINLLIAIGIYLVTPLVLARLAWDVIEQPFMKLRFKFKAVYQAPFCEQMN